MCIEIVFWQPFFTYILICKISVIFKEKFEDNIGGSRIRKLKKDKDNVTQTPRGKKKSTQNVISMHIKRNILIHVSKLNPGLFCLGKHILRHANSPC